MKNKMYIKLLGLILCTSMLLPLTGCGKDVKSPQEIEYEQVAALTQSEYLSQIRESRIVSPYAIINSFTKDFNEAANVYNNVVLAVEVTPDDITQGKMFIDDTDIVEGYYAYYQEGFEDEEEEHNRTSLVISINKDYERYIQYGQPTTIEMEKEDGTTYTEEVPGVVSKYFLVGKISKVVGDRNSVEDKINIIIQDALLIPATTYAPYDLTQLGLSSEVIENGTLVVSDEVLDTSSGEGITQSTHEFYFGDNDYDENGFSDVLRIRYDEFSTTSTLAKILNSNIYKKIKTPINGYIQILFNDNNDTANAFNIPFPMKLNTLISGKCNAFDGSFVKYVKIDLDGYTKPDLFKEGIDNETLANNFDEIKEKEFLLEGKSLLFCVTKEKSMDITVDMLDGSVENLSTPTHLWLKVPEIKMSGKIDGEVYNVTNFPFKMIYNPELRFYDDHSVKEMVANEYEFYDYDSYVEDGNLIKVSELSDNFNLYSVKNICVSSTKNLLENVEVDSISNGVEVGTGYYYNVDENGKKTLDKCDVFYTGNKKFKITTLSQDEHEKGLFWLGVTSETGNRGFIPIKIDGNWTSTNAKFAYYDNVNNKNYYLFSKNGENGIFEELK